MLVLPSSTILITCLMLIASYSFLGTDLSVVISPVLSSSTIVAYDCCKQELYFMDVVFHN